MQAQLTTTSPNKISKFETILRTFWSASWLGWQIESNWADPFVFAIYSIIKPLSSAGIIVVMYGVITGGDFQNPVFAYIYLGNAFYIYVGQVMSGISWTVVDDREHYRTLKFIYVAPIHIPTYLLGRGVAKFIFASFAVFITVLFGVIFLKVPLVLAAVNWPLFILSLLLGIVMLSMMGLMLASVMLLMVHHSEGLGEGVAGALYLFSGAVFPLDVLPAWLRPIGYVMPITYWLELIRRSLIGSIAEAFPALAEFSDVQLLGILTGLSILFGFAAFKTFKYCDREARERGYIDRTTNY